MCDYNFSQAFDTKNSLIGQRNSLLGSAGGLSNLTGTHNIFIIFLLYYNIIYIFALNINYKNVILANVPGFGRLIDGIQRKKSSEQLVIAIVIGLLVCITIWWIFLR